MVPLNRYFRGGKPCSESEISASTLEKWRFSPISGAMAGLHGKWRKIRLIPR
jgi:hypothetical protein